MGMATGTVPGTPTAVWLQDTFDFWRRWRLYAQRLVQPLRWLLPGLLLGLCTTGCVSRHDWPVEGLQEFRVSSADGADTYLHQQISQAGTEDGQWLALDVQGAKLLRIRDGIQDLVHLWLPDQRNFAFSRDLVVLGDQVYLAATFSDAVYAVGLAELQEKWAIKPVFSEYLKFPSDRPQTVQVRVLAPDDPQLPIARQHFLRTGVWLPGQPRADLLARAGTLAAPGWPVALPGGGQGALREVTPVPAPAQTGSAGPTGQKGQQGQQGQLCVALATARHTRPRPLCVPLPDGWKAAAVYPVGVRPAESPGPGRAQCAGVALGPDARWLWLEVDLVGESARAIETRTLLTRIALEGEQLQCWDRLGHAADLKSQTRLMRVYALVGNAPRTLELRDDRHWSRVTPTLTDHFWPTALATFSAPVRPDRPDGPAPDSLAQAQRQEILERALAYTTQPWQMPNSALAQERYVAWNRRGYFGFCGPDTRICSKPLAPRYLARKQLPDRFIGVPYGWGAADTPEQFVREIAKGAYPGDATADRRMLRSVAGVDASGLLGNVWQLPNRVVTTCRGGPDPWTPTPGNRACLGAYGTRVAWESGQTGDALLLPGHVRLLAQAVEPQLAQAGLGLYAEIVESSGACAGSCHRLLPVRELGRYRVVRRSVP